MARVLILDSNYREKLQRIRKFAEDNPISWKHLQKMAKGEIESVGNSHLFRAEIPIGYRVVFSIEQQPAGLCRHLFVSVESPNKLPHPAALSEVMKELGFDRPFQECKVWIEGEVAINVLELMEKEGMHEQEEYREVQSVPTLQ